MSDPFKEFVEQIARLAVPEDDTEDNRRLREATASDSGMPISELDEFRHHRLRGRVSVLGGAGTLCQVRSWNENMNCFSDLAINSENISRRYSHY